MCDEERLLILPKQRKRENHDQLTYFLKVQCIPISKIQTEKQILIVDKIL